MSQGQGRAVPCFFNFLSFFIYLFYEIGSHYVTQAGLKLGEICLPLDPNAGVRGVATRLAVLLLFLDKVTLRGPSWPGIQS